MSTGEYSANYFSKLVAIEVEITYCVDDVLKMMYLSYILKEVAANTKVQIQKRLIRLIIYNYNFRIITTNVFQWRIIIYNFKYLF